MKKFAIINTQFEGVHNWDSAPESVSYLRNLHRHVFYVTVKIEQYNINRDIEFILFKKVIEKLIDELVPVIKLGEQEYKKIESCEHLAQKLLIEIEKKYEGRGVSVQVFEDKENGAEVEDGIR